jgi:phosphatidylinositol alpha-1,6-mannosyltransferase
VFAHGLDVIYPSWIYQSFFASRLRHFDRVIVNSQATRKLVLGAGVASEKVAVIHPGVELPGPITANGINAFKDRLGLKFDQMLVFVGRLTERKGLSGFIRTSWQTIAADRPQLGLIIVGDGPNAGSKQSETHRGEKAAVLAAMRSNACGAQIRLLGRLSDRDLVLALASSDIHLFPILESENDVEGFGMVAIEAAATGTPTVAFDVGGVADAVAPDGGVLVPNGNYAELEGAIVEILSDSTFCEDRLRAHASRFEWDKHKHALLSELRCVLKEPRKTR